MLRTTLLTTLTLLIAQSALAAEGEIEVRCRQTPDEDLEPDGPLGETPKHVTDAYPLSDQENKGGWVKFEPMSDEFEGKELDRNKWNRGHGMVEGSPACPVQRQERHRLGRQVAPDDAQGEAARRGGEAGLQGLHRPPPCTPRSGPATATTRSRPSR